MFASRRSRFYGPSITTMSALLTEPLHLWLTQLEFNTCEADPYLFHPSTDASRCLTSSQWCSTVKAAFQKHTTKAPPPKLLRASFVRRPRTRSACGRALSSLDPLTHTRAPRCSRQITWLRDDQAAPDVLKAAAKAMRHKLETADSDVSPLHNHTPWRVCACPFSGAPNAWSSSLVTAVRQIDA